MKKSKLLIEAIAAFKTHYGEPPADAGYPVIREKTDRVFFARSKDDWHAFVKSQHVLAFMAVALVLIILAIFVGMVIGVVYVRNYEPLIWGLGSYALCIFLIAIICRFLTPKQRSSEIREYDSERKKFSVIGI